MAILKCLKSEDSNVLSKKKKKKKAVSVLDLRANKKAHAIIVLPLTSIVLFITSGLNSLSTEIALATIEAKRASGYGIFTVLVNKMIKRHKQVRKKYKY